MKDLSLYEKKDVKISLRLKFSFTRSLTYSHLLKYLSLCPSVINLWPTLCLLPFLGPFLSLTEFNTDLSPARARDHDLRPFEPSIFSILVIPENRRWALFRVGLVTVGCAFTVCLHAQHRLGPDSSFEAPRIQAASDEGERAIARMTYPSGWKAELWAAEPDVAHGVALDVVDDGRVFVVESFRAWRGVPDIRGIMSWLDEDLACASVDDRLAMMKRHLGEEGMKLYYRNTERIRLLEDRENRGRATRSVVFAENFATPLDGVAAGVLARGKDVWFANIPNVWHLRDEDGDGIADSRRSISYGHGVRVGFLGHDLHGLTFGPDGRLYFSIGDRASVLQTEGRTVGTPDTGAVFRCRPDGSGMEMFYSGLRNPQDLVFDEWGNLFTGDNNSDGGDQSRWTYLIEGGDSGWRIGWQFLERPNPRGPWNSERMWAPQNESHPAYITPPIKNIGAGPSGVSYYPGTGLDDSWQGTFTMADFRGSSAGSGLWKFKLKPKGSSFELVANEERFIWSVNVTDGHWGPDGAFWLLDWYDGWEPQGKGRIYRFFDPQAVQQPLVQTTQRLLREGFAQRTEVVLLDLLAHPNYRVRQGAQFELAARGQSTANGLIRVARTSKNLHARLHAIWALGQLSDSQFATARGATSPYLEPLIELAGDSEPYVRSNIARVLGDARYGRAYDALLKLTSDSNLHTRALASIALGKLGRREAVPALIAVLRNNADTDAHLRHAAVWGLSLSAQADDLFPLIEDSNEAVRMGVLLTFRQWRRNEIHRFLQDTSPRIVTEAARAINDLPIPGAMPELAALIGRVSGDDALVRRVVNANYRFGTRETAEALARFAAQSNAKEAIRAEALDALAVWPKNPGRDRITGLWRPTAFARDVRSPGEALSGELETLLGSVPNRVRAAAARAAGELDRQDAAPRLARIVAEQEGDADLRVAALNALARLDAAELGDILEQAAEDPEEEVRKVATRLLAGDVATSEARAGRRGGRRGDRPENAGAMVRRLSDVIEKGALSERQNALATLGELSGAEADAALRTWMNQLLAGEAPKELALDIYEAAAKRPALQELVAQFDASQEGEDDLGAFRMTLYGGSIEAGRKVFVERVEVSCVRCHRAEGEGGEVGPPMDGLIAKQNREYLLRSIVHPNADIAEGYDNMLIILKNDDLYAGVIHSENETELVLNSPEDGFVTIQVADIEEREKGMSGMPEGFGDILSKRDLRDLVEYLASLK